MAFLKCSMCTIIVNHLWKMHEVLKVHHISYCIREMHDLLAWKRLASLI